MRAQFPPMTLNYAKLLRLARQNPKARELRLSPSDFRSIAVKESTTPMRPVKPPDAPADWVPPVPAEPTRLRFDAGHGPVTAMPDETMKLGEVDFR